MNRRSFLKLLGFASAGAVSVFETLGRVTMAEHAPQWYAYQSPRVMSCYNKEYLDALDEIMRSGKFDAEQYLAKFRGSE